MKRKKLRWSKVAFRDVVLKSMPLACDNSNRSTTDDDAKSAEERNEVLREVAELRIELGPDDNFDYEKEEDNNDDQKVGSDEYDDYDADDAVDDDDGASSDFNESGDEEQDEKAIAPTKSNNNRANIKVSKSGLIKRKEARTRICLSTISRIGAHIRGMSETALQNLRLREVAKAAPCAPQVYSSL